MLPPVTVKGDSTLLHQLCANLLDNALRYTPEHGRIAIVGHTQNGSVCVGISDTGSGIAPEHLPHVFERFYRADKARSQDGGGSGLGLAICWEIARAHGGDVRIESTVGQGCTCTVILPLEEHEPQ